MGVMPGDILDTIDNALNDFWTSRDAMRWCPGGSDGQERPAPAWETDADVLAHGLMEFFPPAVTPVITEMREGDIVTVSGQRWRVARRTYENGVYTFNLNPAP